MRKKLKIKMILGELLGKGNYAKVYALGHDKVAKVIEIKSDTLFTAFVEISVLKKLDHPCIPKILDVIRDDNFIYLIMPRYSKTRPESLTVFNEFLKMVDTLNYLEQCGIVHGDISIENIMYSNTGPVIIDFGLAAVCPHGELIYFSDFYEPDYYRKIQAPYYRSPTVWNEEAYDSRIDLWSYFCCLYEWILHGENAGNKDFEPLFPVRTKFHFFGIFVTALENVKKLPENHVLTPWVKKYFQESSKKLLVLEYSASETSSFLEFRASELAIQLNLPRYAKINIDDSLDSFVRRLTNFVTNPKDFNFGINFLKGNNCCKYQVFAGFGVLTCDVFEKIDCQLYS